MASIDDIPTGQRLTGAQLVEALADDELDSTGIPFPHPIRPSRPPALTGITPRTWAWLILAGVGSWAVLLGAGWWLIRALG